MAKRGKNINVFLMDGEATGRIKATISNWIGVAYKIPRHKLFACKERDDLSQSGVYFLFGNNDEGDVVYIGQAGVRKNGSGILARLNEHDKNPDKDYWTEAVVFTTSNNSFGPTELSFLENKFCNMSIASGNFKVKNVNDPTLGNITEEKESELEEFADYAELILGVLGYKVFVTRGEVERNSNQECEIKKKIAIEDNENTSIPQLPDAGLKIGEYVRLAMKNLSASGYSFTEDDIKLMCSSEWTEKHFHTKHAFMKVYTQGVTDNKDSEGKYVRFWADPFVYGTRAVLISKEWYENKRKLFESWYNSLK